MNRFFHMMRLASSVIKSRGFAVSVLAVLMSLTVYAVSSTTNTVYFPDLTAMLPKSTLPGRFQW